MHITNDIRYVGVNDHKIDLFEGFYPVPNGMAYNSYVIIDEKICVMDSVERDFGAEWLHNIREELGGRTPDYLIVQHMEPDHSGSIRMFMEAFPQAVVVSSSKAFPMMKAFSGEDYAARRLVVKEGDTLSLGRHELSFIAAPMVHWPEVIMTYDRCDKVFFSADAFGKFGALDVEEEWACEARRYYFGIVGKYGVQVQALLKKAAALDIKIICSLHGPVLSQNLGQYLKLYDIWSSYGVETDGAAIFYASIYGNTKEAALLMKRELEARGAKAVAIHDLARTDMTEAVEDAFRYGRIVLASSTYNGDVFSPMHEFIHHLTLRGIKNRTVGLIENGSWAPMAAKVMRAMLEPCKGLSVLENAVTVRSVLDDASRAQIADMADALMKDETKE